MSGPRARSIPRLFRAAGALAVVLGSSGTLGCKCDRNTDEPERTAKSAPSAPASVAAAAPAPDVLFWDFAAPEAPTLLSLWPADSSAPESKSVGIKTTNEQGAAVVEVDGTNPHAEWAFKPPLDAGILSFEIETTREEELHVTVRSKNCPSAVDACSWSEKLGIGRQFAEFVLPVRQIHALRVRFPEEVGTRRTIHRLRLVREPKATSGYRSGQPDAQIMLMGHGLQIATPVGDASIVLQVAGLEAAAVGSVVLDVGTGEFAPQMFWEGTACANFSEECSVRLSSWGTRRYAAELAGHPKWSGRIDGLRLDPADPPGAYLIRRLALQRTPLTGTDAGGP